MGPVRSVDVVSTGTVRIRPEHVESNGTSLYWWLFTSTRWTTPRPINVYVIEHDDGLVLFDAGQDRRSVTEADYFPTGFTGLIYSRLARFQIGPDQTLSARLASIGHDVSDVRTVVLSHLHQDHIGGLRELSGAEVLVSATEWAQLDDSRAAMKGFLVNHIDLPGIRWKLVEPAAVTDAAIAPFRTAHDVYGDGSLLLLPTPGHTPGSLSMLVRQPGMPPLLMVGDVTYDVRLLEAGRVPGVGEAERLRRTTTEIAALRRRHPDLVVLAAHDPAAADLLQASQATRGAA